MQRVGPGQEARDLALDQPLGDVKGLIQVHRAGLLNAYSHSRQSIRGRLQPLGHGAVERPARFARSAVLRIAP